jgi:hypothetical protein
MRRLAAINTRATSFLGLAVRLDAIPRAPQSYFERLSIEKPGVGTKLIIVFVRDHIFGRALSLKSALGEVPPVPLSLRSQFPRAVAARMLFAMLRATE